MYTTFKINTENNSNFNKFDNAIYEYEIENGSGIRLFQIKHITASDVKKCNSKQRMLRYFKTFLDVKKETQYFIIFNNVDVGLDIPIDLFEEIDAPDDIFNLSKSENENNLPKMYRLVYQKLAANKFYKQFKVIVENFENKDEMIENFCEKFIYAFFYANKSKMEAIIVNKMENLIQLQPSNGIYMEYFDYVITLLKWLEDKYKNGGPLIDVDMKIIISLIKSKAESFSTDLGYSDEENSTTTAGLVTSVANVQLNE